MQTDKRTLTDRQIELVIGMVLRVGVIAAAAVVVLGGALFLLAEPHATPRYSPFHGEPANLTSAASIIKAAMSLDSSSIIQLGILLLMSVPIARVVLSTAAFFMQRDWLYFAVTLTVLSLLLVSLLGIKP